MVLHDGQGTRQSFAQPLDLLETGERALHAGVPGSAGRRREAVDDEGRDTHASGCGGLLEVLPLGIGHHHRALLRCGVLRGLLLWSDYGHRDRWCRVLLMVMLWPLRVMVPGPLVVRVWSSRLPRALPVLWLRYGLRSWHGSMLCVSPQGCGYGDHMGDGQHVRGFRIALDYRVSTQGVVAHAMADASECPQNDPLTADHILMIVFFRKCNY